MHNLFIRAQMGSNHAKKKKRWKARDALPLMCDNFSVVRLGKVWNSPTRAGTWDIMGVTKWTLPRVGMRFTTA